jgi:enoyl-CoA hydratase
VFSFARPEVLPVSVVHVDHPSPLVTVVTLHRPDRLNAMSIELVTELHDALTAVAADNVCRVVVLTGSGRAFCSGLDLKDHGVVPGIDGLQVGQIAQKAMAVYSRLTPLLRSMPQPVIAAVNGDAYGGGMCLTLGADLRFAAEGARFNATGIVNGLTSTEMGASWLLPRLVGAAHSNDLLMTGRVVDADEAHRMGLVSRVLPAGSLLDETLAVADRMAGFSRYGLAMTKSTVWANLEISSLAAAQELEDRNQLMLGFTDNLPEAMRAFAEEREPVYRDEPRKDLYGAG